MQATSFKSADPALVIAEAGRRLGPPLLWTFSVWPHLAMRAQESDGWILAKAYHGTAKCFLLGSETGEMLRGASKPWSCHGGSLAKAYPGLRKVFSYRFRNLWVSKLTDQGLCSRALPSLGAVMELALPRPTLAPQSVFLWF